MPRYSALLAAVALLMGACGCSRTRATAASAPAPTSLENDEFVISNPAAYPLTAIQSRLAPGQLTLSGVILAEPGRTIDVISPVAGRLDAVRAQLGDTVQAGTVLATVYSASLRQAYSDDAAAQSSAQLARSELNRARDLLAHGALPAAQVEIAADAYASAQARAQALQQQLQLWGAPLAPTDALPLRAPRAGVVIAQEATNGLQVPSADAGKSLFTIADLSEVWVAGTVYENQLGQLHTGDHAAVSFTAYPGRQFQGRVANLSAVLDPATRSAAARIVLPNPGVLLKPGMFATVQVQSRQRQTLLSVPATAVVRTQDRSFVYVSEGGNRFRRVAVSASSTGDAGEVAITAVVHAGERVVTNALDLTNALQIGGGS